MASSPYLTSGLRHRSKDETYSALFSNSVMTQRAWMMYFKEEIKELFFLLSAVENLQNLLFSRIKDPNLLTEESKVQEGGLLRRAETFGGADSNPAESAMNSKLIYF